jgi:hypothetical protein
MAGREEQGINVGAKWIQDVGTMYVSNADRLITAFRPECKQRKNHGKAGR